MQNRDGNDPGAITDDQRAVMNEAGDLVPGGALNTVWDVLIAALHVWGWCSCVSLRTPMRQVRGATLGGRDLERARVAPERAAPNENTRRPPSPPPPPKKPKYGPG